LGRRSGRQGCNPAGESPVVFPPIAGRWRAGPWDIASRAHILLRSSEFGLSGFQNYVQKGVNEGRLPKLVGGGLIREKVSIEELTSGSRRKEVSAIRKRIAIGLVEKYGIFPEPLQEIISPHFLLSRQLG